MLLKGTSLVEFRSSERSRRGFWCFESINIALLTE